MKKFVWITVFFACCLLMLLVSMAMANTAAGAHTLQAARVASFQNGVDDPGTSAGSNDSTDFIALPKGTWVVTGTITAQNTSSADHVVTCSFNPAGEAQAIVTRTVAASSQQTFTLSDTFVGPVSLSFSCKSDDYPAASVAFTNQFMMITSKKSVEKTASA